MSWDRVANTLTTNSGVISSDVKGHPMQHRVLSLREILIIASVCSYPNFQAPWSYEFGERKSSFIREIVGECFPPLFAFVIAQHLNQLVSA
jgi:site-specific DNA-cytosine methylase